MALMSRFGTGLLILGGLVLASLMGYTLSLEVGGNGWVGPSDGADVAVVFPDRANWNDFRQGIWACDQRGLVRVTRDENDSLTVEAPTSGRPIRFAWHRAQGLVETRDTVRRLMQSNRPPAAVVGSINTALTAALAESLREIGSKSVLIVPWATAVRAEVPGLGDSSVPLLEIDRGRTFRFTPNNRRQAEMVVRCLADQEDSPPGRVIVAVDPGDPYSVDLADCFREAIHQVTPECEIIARVDAATSPGLAETPGSAERLWAEWVWRTALDGNGKKPPWVVLPLQAEPTRRMLNALRATAPADAAQAPLRVLCGDGVGPESLRDFAGSPAFSVWCVSSASGPTVPGVDVARDAQVPAEIVSALVRGLDGPDGPEELLRSLKTLDLKPGDPAAMGRSLAFDLHGERRGSDLGHVITVRPGRSEVLGIAPKAGGGWSEPSAIPATPFLAGP